MSLRHYRNTSLNCSSRYSKVMGQFENKPSLRG
jgi:hypothetical protein